VRERKRNQEREREGERQTTDEGELAKNRTKEKGNTDRLGGRKGGEILAHKF